MSKQEKPCQPENPSSVPSIQNNLGFTDMLRSERITYQSNVVSRLHLNNKGHIALCCTTKEPEAEIKRYVSLAEYFLQEYCVWHQYQVGQEKLFSQLFGEVTYAMNIKTNPPLPYLNHYQLRDKIEAHLGQPADQIMFQKMKSYMSESDRTKAEQDFREFLKRDLSLLAHFAYYRSLATIDEHLNWVRLSRHHSQCKSLWLHLRLGGQQLGDPPERVLKVEPFDDKLHSLKLVKISGRGIGNQFHLAKVMWGISVVFDVDRSFTHTEYEHKQLEWLMKKSTDTLDHLKHLNNKRNELEQFFDYLGSVTTLAGEMLGVDLLDPNVEMDEEWADETIKKAISNQLPRTMSDIECMNWSRTLLHIKAWNFMQAYHPLIGLIRGLRSERILRGIDI